MLSYLKKFAKGSGVMLISVSLVLPGCETLPANEVGDTCASLRDPMRQVVERYNERLVQGAVAGGLGGALIGGLAAAALGGDIGAGIAIGATTGIISGTVNAYYQNKLDQQLQGAALQRSISQDISQSQTELRTIGSALTRLNACRLRQIDDIRQRIEDGESGETTRQALADVRRRSAQDQELIQKVVGDVAAGSALYADAYAQSRDLESDAVVERAQRYQPRVDYVPQGQIVSYAYATQSSNVRAGPGTGYATIGGVARGQRVGVVSGAPGSGWTEVAFGGRKGYIAGRLLSTSRPAAPSRPQSGGTGDFERELVVASDSDRPAADNEAEELIFGAKDLQVSQETQATIVEDRLDSVEDLLA